MAFKLYWLKEKCQGCSIAVPKAFIQSISVRPGAAQLPPINPSQITGQSEHHQSGGARCRTSFVRSHRFYLWLPDAIRISLYAQKFIGTSVYRIPLTSVDESVRPIVRLTTAAASARVM